MTNRDNELDHLLEPLRSTKPTAHENLRWRKLTASLPDKKTVVSSRKILMFVSGFGLAAGFAIGIFLGMSLKEKSITQNDVACEKVIIRDATETELYTNLD